MNYNYIFRKNRRGWPNRRESGGHPSSNSNHYSCYWFWGRGGGGRRRGETQEKEKEEGTQERQSQKSNIVIGRGTESHHERRGKLFCNLGNFKLISKLFSFFRSGRKSAKSKMKKLEDWQWSKRHERQQRQDMMWFDKDVSSIFNVTNTHLNCSKIPRNQTSPNKKQKTLYWCSM